MRLLIFAVITLLFTSQCSDRHDSALTIKPPFKGIKTPETRVVIDPTIRQTVRLANGMSLEIPENAFSDVNGNLINSEVTLTLSSYETAAQIIASGIPMTYYEGGQNRNFESAGMFQVSGKADSLDVLISEGKELIVNYASNVFGDFDFFRFDKETDNATVSGQWRKLTPTSALPEWSADTLKKFKMRFAKEDYPELTSLMGIDWKLATSHTNPNEEVNQWALQEVWSSLEISQPKLGFGPTIFSDHVNYNGYLGFGAIVVTKDKSRIITTHKSITKFWSRKGNLIKTIDKVRTDYEPVRILNDKYVLISRTNGDDIYDLQGNLMGSFPKTRNLELAHTKDVVVYHKVGIKPTVYIADISGQLIKQIELWEDVRYMHQPDMIERFILTAQDKLITNSLDGVRFFDLEGNLLDHRDEEFMSIESFNDHWLLMRGMEGELTAWDYQNNYETTSNPKDFNLRTIVERSGRTWSYDGAGIQTIPNTKFVIISEAKSSKSKIWNYERNETSDLDFRLYYSSYDNLPAGVVAGYHQDLDVFHLYDMGKKKDVLSIKGLNPGFYLDGSTYETRVSEDGKHLLISNYTHAHYYDINGTLIRDFKGMDSLIHVSGFLGKDKIFTLSKNGIYRIWDRSGEEVSSKQLLTNSFSQSWAGKDQIITWNSMFSSRNHFDLHGNLTLNLGRSRRQLFLDSMDILYADETGKGTLKSIFELPSSVYQVIFRNGENEFFTYVYLDRSDLEIINRFYTFRAKEALREGNRQQNETRMLRRFSISQMGLYNWDKFLEEAGNVQFAANFEFEMPVEYNNITIFLLTEFNGQSVITFKRDSWDKFRINPLRKNQLLAILPDNQIAIFSSKDMADLDFSTISKQKEFTFKMKTSDESIQDIIDLERLIE